MGEGRWNGIGVLVMHPRSTSARCRMCRPYLSGGCYLRKCMHCMIRVDRDVNAARNMLLDASGGQSWRLGTAGGFRTVRPSLDEARLLPDMVLDPGRVMCEADPSGWTGNSQERDDVPR